MSTPGPHEPVPHPADDARDELAADDGLDVYYVDDEYVDDEASIDGPDEALDAAGMADVLGPGGLGGLLGGDGGAGGLFGGILEQAQRMQAAVVDAQQELAQARVEGSAGGGLVTATVNGGGELVALTISPQAVDPDDTETLADLVLAAVRDAATNAHRLAEQKMTVATGDFGGMLGSLGGGPGGLPGGFPGLG